MKTKGFITIFMMFIAFSLFSQNADDKKIMRDAEEARDAFLAANPKLQTYFDDAEAYVIFPNVGKGAFILGAATGNGVVYKNGSPIGMATLKQVDIGVQLGGKAFSELVFLQNEKAVQDFMKGNFKLSGNISAIAIDKSTPTLNLKYDDGLAVFTLPKEGLMAEISVGGQKLDYKAFK
ncbi:hypothetical protein EI546_09855 [Aequorivita sp. H23M31]|uniref:Ysc84 actin-binding domain-containing protein n=1 Tax=Aequorivita ciconiae TaxID=2494375 RepID=A0A410G410_9FLAO|nr:lipid-binding SYLF domain-containing protein [Aequorivita sp. H23M31]QAA82007.1 hypothetical protein EI546_09855 [Aequorivita sp. H23M31]